MLLAALAALVAVGLWRTGGQPARPGVVSRRPVGIMGTTARLIAVGPPREAEAALREAEAVLRATEARMSAWLEDSEVARLNAAPAAQEVPLSAEVRRVLELAQRAAEDTGGAFDITCRPLLELWREAGARGRLPAQEEIAAARTASSWGLLALTEAGAVKHAPGVRIDLGGIAKGYGIDRALEALQAAGVRGGLVEVGGDLRCFGEPPDGEAWRVELRDPFGGKAPGRLALREGAVCTSGNYARFVEIEGRRYSHIVDPRTGRPADAVPSATVVAPSAVSADVWATALSVLGDQGLRMRPEGVEALLVVGEAPGKLVCTSGFASLLEEAPAGLQVVR